MPKKVEAVDRKTAPVITMLPLRIHQQVQAPARKSWFSLKA
jgi:hypothetical protein